MDESRGKTGPKILSLVASMLVSETAEIKKGFGANEAGDVVM